MSEAAFQLPRLLQLAGALNTFFGGTILCSSTTAGGTQGFYTTPIALPRDYDRTRPGHVDLFLVTINGVIVGSPGVVLAAVVNYSSPAGPPTTASGQVVVTLPNPFTPNMYIPVEINPGGTPLLPGNTIPDQSVLGIQVFRNGPDANDTCVVTTDLIAVVRIRYNRLCTYGDCF